MRELITSSQFPSIEDVRTWLKEAIKAAQFAKLVASVIFLVSRMRDVNTELMKRLERLQRRPRSERFRSVEAQLCLELGLEPPAKRKREPKKDDKASRERHPGRAKLPAHLERETVDNLVPDAKRICPVCGCEMATVAFTTCEHLDFIPGRFVVKERRDEVVACVHDDTIVAAEPPPRLLPKAKLGDTLVLEALADKFIEHLPIERQALRFARMGVEIAANTLGRSVAAAIDKLLPLADLIAEKTRGPGLLGTDATSLPVLDRDAPDGIRLGTMWAWTNARFVTFVYAPNGTSASVKAFLGTDLARKIQCDGSNVMHFVERAGGFLPGCWSHGRRRFVAAARLGEKAALEPLRLIGQLFEIDRASAEAGEDSVQRLARRLAECPPILDDLRAHVERERAVVPPKMPMGQALGYLHRQWKRLTLFLTDGEIELTNNRRERELRKLVLGRRNWLFTWGDLGGERTAGILTILATAIAYDLNPRAYLHRVGKLLGAGLPDDRLHELLPDKLCARFPELRRPGATRDRPEALTPIPALS